MKSANPYLNFNGTTEEAFNFYKSVFGGEFITVMRFGDMPDAGNGCADMSAKVQNTPTSNISNMIMHIALPLGNNILMGTDAPEAMGFKLVTGNNTYISINTDSKEETDSIFKNLSEGGVVQMQPEQMFWGDYYCSFIDKFGIQWMLSYNPNYN
ncbi:VOC family protein [Mucilaginibacter sp. UR6-1]|uniref:VOC family protein n=1 Tax=Mucilaginibacter sp. UR6-1 TaxID=1435643 RepID=UPI001E52B609|nr:VOC family protein [Mucilaginibacter sp. UR6-1]MCC8410976.1 VOC family protein [Mucilaginibacter sp. UR6-1]